MKSNIPYPVIVLVRTQLPENIGSTARAMKNFGLSDLRLVSPRESWPNKGAKSMAAGADSILENIQVFESIPEALHDVSYTVSLTARNRDITKIEFGPEHAVKKILYYSEKNEKSAIIFGPEQSGLTNDEISVSNALVKVPTEINFSSLNLAQAVLLMSWEWKKIHLKSSLSEEEYKGIIKNSIPGPGACGGMYTANSMSSAIEALGMSLPGSSSQDAVSNSKKIDCVNAGNAIMNLLERDI